MRFFPLHDFKILHFYSIAKSIKFVKVKTKKPSFNLFSLMATERNLTAHFC